MNHKITLALLLSILFLSFNTQTANNNDTERRHRTFIGETFEGAGDTAQSAVGTGLNFFTLGGYNKAKENDRKNEKQRRTKKQKNKNSNQEQQNEILNEEEELENN